MKKYLFISMITSCLLGFLPVIFAVTPVTGHLPDPRVNCKDFLLSEVVMDQIREEALGLPDSAQYQVTYHADKDYCELTVADKEDQKIYHLTTESTNNFEFDPKDRSFELLLYPANQPTCENTVIATYDDATQTFIDADYDFPLTDGGCAATNAKNANQ